MFVCGLLVLLLVNFMLLDCRLVSLLFSFLAVCVDLSLIVGACFNVSVVYCLLWVWAFLVA